MKNRNYKKLIRKIHRYLGIFIGIQVLLWTVSGIFFSWTNINEIRGDHLREDRDSIKPLKGEISTAEIQNKILETDPKSTIKSVRIVNVMDANYFEVIYENTEKKNSTILLNTETGNKRKPLSQKEAEQTATSALVKKTNVKQTVYLTENDIGLHHEYREKPLPAWAVTFDHSENLTVYVSADNGQVQSFRTRSWRIFDFLWMLHTMDFAGRDNFNNWLLRAISVGSLLMIISGFFYFLMTARKPW